MPTPEVIGLFPTPFMRVPGALARGLVAGLVEHFSAAADRANNSSPQSLAHRDAAARATARCWSRPRRSSRPLLAEFGALLFGERLGWSLKEMWVNVLDTGGRQAMHNHANSFISGVVYLTPTHPDASTVFMKSPGGTEFAFKNDHAGVATGPYNADKWISPPPGPATWCCFRAICMHACPRIRASGASPWPSTPSRPA